MRFRKSHKCHIWLFRALCPTLKYHKGCIFNKNEKYFNIHYNDIWVKQSAIYDICDATIFINIDIRQKHILLYKYYNLRYETPK